MTSPPEADAIATELLAVLRARTGLAEAAFTHLPERLAGGEDAVSLAFTLAHAPAPLDRPLVLRLLTGRGDALPGTAARARFEAAVHEAVAEAGFPCPRPRLVGDEALIAGMHFLVLEQLPGQSLWSRMMPPSTHTFGAGALLAEAQTRLHALDPGPLEAAVTALGDARRLHPEHMLEWSDAELDRRGGAPLHAAWEWLRAERPAAVPPAICHANAHPQNVIVEGERFVGLIDWTDVQIADPHFDVAQTVVLLHFAPTDAPPQAAQALDAMRRALQVQYRRAYARSRSLDEQRLAYWEAFAIARRLLQAAAAARGGGASGWAHPDVRRRLTSRFRGLTGLGPDPGEAVVWV